MRDLLRKWKLILPFRMEVDISKREFNNRLRSIMMENTPGLYSDLDDLVQPEEIKYKGDVDEEGFEFVPKQNFFGTRMSATTKGKYQEADGKLVIEGEVNSFSFGYLFLFSLSIMIYGAIAAFVVYVSRDDLTFCMIIGGLFIAFYAIVFTIHIWLLRKSTREVKYQVERDLYYLTRDDFKNIG